MVDALDPDSYFEYVLAGADPAGPAPSRGPVAQWRRWTWSVQACARTAPFDGAVAITRATARERGISEAAIRRRLRSGAWWQPVRGTLTAVPVDGNDRVAMRRRHALTAAALVA